MKKYLKVSAIALGSVVALNMNVACADTMGNMKPFEAGVQTGYEYSKLKAGITAKGVGTVGSVKSRANLWGLRGHVRGEVCEGMLAGVGMEGSAGIAWAFREERKFKVGSPATGSFLGRSRKDGSGTTTTHFGGGISYNLAHLMGGADQYFLRPVFGYRFDNQHLDSKKLKNVKGAKSQSIKARWKGFYAGADLGGFVADRHMVGVRGAYHFAVVNTIKDQVHSTKRHGRTGYEASARYRYSITEMFGVDVITGYDQRSGGSKKKNKNKRKWSSFYITTGVSGRV